jgi:hypothetical protein
MRHAAWRRPESLSKNAAGQIRGGVGWLREKAPIIKLMSEKPAGEAP